MGDRRGPEPLAYFGRLQKAMRNIPPTRNIPVRMSCQKGAYNMPELADLLLYGGAALLGFVLITKILPRKKSDRHRQKFDL